MGEPARTHVDRSADTRRDPDGLHSPRRKGERSVAQRRDRKVRECEGPGEGEDEIKQAWRGCRKQPRLKPPAAPPCAAHRYHARHPWGSFTRKKDCIFRL